MEKLLYSIPETANVLSIGTTKLYEEIAAGNIECRKLGKRTLISKEALDDYIKRLEVK